MGQGPAIANLPPESTMVIRFNVVIEYVMRESLTGSLDISHV